MMARDSGGEAGARPGGEQSSPSSSSHHASALRSSLICPGRRDEQTRAPNRVRSRMDMRAGLDEASSVVDRSSVIVAYGALMCPAVRRRRGMGASRADVATLGAVSLPGLRLSFRVRQAAYATLWPNDGTVEAPDAQGVLLRVSAPALAMAAKGEGGYVLRPVTAVSLGENVSTPCQAFVGSWWHCLPRNARPTEAYLAKVKQGAEVAGLERSYIGWLESLDPAGRPAEALAARGKTPTEVTVLSTAAVLGSALCVGAISVNAH